MTLQSQLSNLRQTARSHAAQGWELANGIGPALVSAVLPSGITSIARTASAAERYTRHSDLEMAIESATWKTLLGSPQSGWGNLAIEPGDRQSPFAAAGAAGIAQWMTVRLPSYVLPGYPAVLHLFRAENSNPITKEQLNRLRDAVDQKSEGRSSDRCRLFLLNASSEPLASEDDWAAIESKIKLEILAKVQQLLERVAETNEPERDRVAHIQRTGEMVSVRYIALPSHPATERKPAVVVAIQPTVDEWLKIHADDLPADREFGRFLPALRFIYDQSGNNPSLANIARSVYLSQFHFHRKFGELIGMTPKQYLLECQIAKAQSLLSEGGLELSKVAERCGFAHQSHFTSRFKQATGLTPTRWRRLVNRVDG